MPREETDLEAFMKKLKSKGASAVTIKQNKDNYKFKLRCKRFLFTYVLRDTSKVEKMKSALPPGLAVKEVKLTK